MIPCFNEATCMRSTNLEQDIINSAAAGFKAMELRKEKLIRYLRSGHTLEEVKALIQKYDIRLTCINALQGIYMETPYDKTKLRDACDFICYCGKYLGCYKLEYLAPYKVPIEDPEELEQYTVDSLLMLSDVCRNYGVKLAIEYLGIPNNSIQTFEQALRIVNKVNRDNVGLLVDTWHHYMSGSKPEEFLKADNGQIFMVHVSDCTEHEPFTAIRSECIWPGDGVVPIAEDLAYMKQAGYEEEVSIEIFDKDIQKADPAIIVPEAFKRVTKYV